MGFFFKKKWVKIKTTILLRIKTFYFSYFLAKVPIPLVWILICKLFILPQLVDDFAAQFYDKSKQKQNEKTKTPSAWPANIYMIDKFVCWQIYVWQFSLQNSSFHSVFFRKISLIFYNVVQILHIWEIIH